ncbi:DUF4175 family protein [Salegentibacter sp. F188]|uniref:DUF4175 family protein n=1 Tax=Autumnicola patrickiae TaxID=3075591 RepID=A0ABU3E0Y6_9FLAO|nr:DUF4175 family protein [Salegentibacter sp. F188]MDT0689612.1 DUF4175 family protein [Salegentibacter sp. F188]
MDHFKKIQEKLEAFIRKYYLNLLLKGAILFVTVGLLYFLLILGIEYFFWLNSFGRALLFWLFIAVEMLLLLKFILIPLFKLLKLSEGLNKVEASRLIGRHFPEVSDKLLNVLQLKENSSQSDLLLASIDQKAKDLQPVPFTSAVNYRTSLRYSKFAIFPIVIVLALIFTGNSSFFSESYARVSNYNTAYEPPAPFLFHIQNENLKVEEDKDLRLVVETTGKIIPENVSIHFNDQTYFLKSEAPGVFEFTFKRLNENVNFHISSNEVKSLTYEVEVVEVPKLLNFDMAMDYPAYTGKQDEIISGTGNARIPEGTKVSWTFNTRNTKLVNLKYADTVVTVSSKEPIFDYNQQVFYQFPYELSTSNEEINDYQKLQYRIEVIKDEYPEIEVEQKIDSLDNTTRYLRGRISDDYGLSGLELVYYKEGKEEDAENWQISTSSQNFEEFLLTFPGEINLEKGNNYQYFFRVYDNDAINGGKSTKSEVFSYRERSLEEIEAEKLQNQGRSIENLSEGLEKMENSEKELEEISRLQKESEKLDYNQRKKIEDFINRQKRQSELMQNYSEKLKRSLKKTNDKNDSFREELERRTDKNEERLQKNEELLKELEEIADKINREELGQKLEQLSKQNQNQKRNLEQLLELTKQYYVEEKKQKLSMDLEKLAEDQETLAESEDNSAEAQDEISKEFEEFREEMDQLEKDNEALKSPKELGREEVDEESIEKEQKEASEELEQGNKKEAREKQKNAAKKMQKMSQTMQAQSMQQQGEQLDADIKTLRQILDNLVTFSFEQENLLEVFKDINQDNPLYASKLKRQSILREHFEHVDDSLYTLALRNPMIDEEITSNLTDIDYDIEKALERLSDNQLPQGIASQQYVVTRSNDLAYLLSQMLSGMQQMANPQMGKGKGGEEVQLMDIIKKQEELSGKMKDGMKKGEQKGEQNGEGEKRDGQDGEGMNGKLFEIYKQQMELRENLERLLEKEGKNGNGDQLKEEMEELEEELLDKKFDPQNLQKMLDLQHELLKFQDAKLQQGEDDKRTSESNKTEFNNAPKDQNLKAKEYFKATEILNRQILPLRQIYKQKVKEYFDGGSD